MSTDHPSPDEQKSTLSRFAFLERVAATVLILVVLSLGWIILVSFQPDWLRLPVPLRLLRWAC